MNKETILIQFHENHHWTTTLDVQYEDRWDIAGLWVNNDTDEPCDQNPCQICKQLSNLGITI